jgi:nitrate/nitrite transport system permease protein
MVSAVFHSPSEASAAARAMPAAVAASTAVPPAKAKPVRISYDWNGLALKVLPPLFGIAILVGIWALLTMKSTTFPTPWATFKEAVVVFSDPFYSKGPNDQGIGWNILFSLERVAVGFGLAAVVGIPVGFMIGRFKVLNSMVSPLIGRCRLWLGCRLACWCSKRPTRPPFGPSSFAPSGP